MVKIPATAAAAILPVNAFCLPLDNRDGLHTENTSDVLDSEVISAENSFKIERQGPMAPGFGPRARGGEGGKNAAKEAGKEAKGAGKTSS